MLVLTRAIGQSVVIGNNIVVTVEAVRGDRVRLGFAAPTDVRVDRSEVRRKIDAQASKPAPCTASKP